LPLAGGARGICIVSRDNLPRLEHVWLKQCGKDGV
jgi:hypothetical protein